MFIKRALLRITNRSFSTTPPRKVLIASLPVKIMPMKLCSSCKFFNETQECKKFTRSVPDMLHGKATYIDARDARNDESACGFDAKHFEYLNHELVKRDAFMEANKNEIARGVVYFVGADVGCYLSTMITGNWGILPFVACSCISATSLFTIVFNCFTRNTYKYVPTQNPLEGDETKQQ